MEQKGVFSTMEGTPIFLPCRIISSEGINVYRFEIYDMKTMEVNVLIVLVC